MSSQHTVDVLMSTLEDSRLDFAGLKDRGLKLVELAAKSSKKAAEDVLEQQEKIADLMRRVKFHGLDAKRAQRNISYRKRQITTIFERVKNKGARILAKEYVEMASDIVSALVLIAKGIIL